MPIFISLGVLFQKNLSYYTSALYLKRVQIVIHYLNNRRNQIKLKGLNRYLIKAYFSFTRRAGNIFTPAFTWVENKSYPVQWLS